MDKRQFLFKTLLSATAFLCVSTSLLTACSDETKDAVTKNDKKGAIAEENPSTDQLDEVYNGKTFLLCGESDRYNGAIANRIKNPVSEPAENLKAVVVTQNAKFDISVDGAAKLARAYNNYASFVFVGVDKNSYVNFVDTLKKVIDNYDEQEMDDEADQATEFLDRIQELRNGWSDNADKDVDVVAFRKNSVYSTDNISKSFSRRSAETVLVQDGDTTSTKFAIGEAEPTAYDYGLSADKLVVWMKDGDALDNGSNEQEEYGIQTYSISGTAGPTIVFGKTINYIINYEIIPLHNCKYNEDRYLIHANAQFTNDKLKVGDETWYDSPDTIYLGEGHYAIPEDNYSMFSGDHTHYGICYWCNPYFRGANLKMDVKPSGQNNEEISIVDAKPVTQTNTSTSPVVGLDYSSDNVNYFTPQVSTNLNGHKFSYHTSKTLPANEAVIYQNSNGATASGVNWSYQGDVQTLVTSWFSIYPSELKAFQTHNWSTDMTWQVAVKNPKNGHSYKLGVSIQPILDEMCDVTSNGTILSVNTTHDYTIDLPIPVRSNKYYRISLSSTGDTKTDNQNFSWIYSTNDDITEELGFSMQDDICSYAKTDEAAQESAQRAFKKYVKALRKKASKQGSTLKFDLELIDLSSNKTVMVCTLDGDNIAFSEY